VVEQPLLKLSHSHSETTDINDRLCEDFRRVSKVWTDPFMDRPVHDPFNVEVSEGFRGLALEIGKRHR
jgi:hypothetical protein